MQTRHPRTVADLMEILDRLPGDMKLAAGRYNSRYGEYDLDVLSVQTLFTDEECSLDLSDKERDRDIETLVFS